MRHRILFKNENFTIEYNTIDNWLKIVWSKQQTIDSIQVGYEKALQYIYQQNTNKLLDDQSQVTDIFGDIIDWLAYEWYPSALNKGLKYHACINSRNSFSNLSTEKLKRLVTKGIIQGFEDVNVAKKWLADFKN
jgi:hypothetical protein